MATATRPVSPNAAYPADAVGRLFAAPESEVLPRRRHQFLRAGARRQADQCSAANHQIAPCNVHGESPPPSEMNRSAGGIKLLAEQPGRALWRGRAVFAIL